MTDRTMVIVPPAERAALEASNAESTYNWPCVVWSDGKLWTDEVELSAWRKMMAGMAPA